VFAFIHEMPMSASAPVSPEQEALLANIIAHPDDDLPRLVYSDWLKENGEEVCSELIRWQVTLAGMRERTGERQRVRQNAIHAWEKFYTTWQKRLRAMHLYKKSFRRGFPLAMTGEQKAYVPYELFSEDSANWWPLFPMRWLEISFDGKTPPTFDEQHYFRRVVSLDCSTHPTTRVMQPFMDGLVIDLFRSRQFVCLEFMNLSGTPISPDIFERVRSSPLLRQLKRLELHSSSSRWAYLRWPEGRYTDGRLVPWECPLGEALDWFIEHMHEL
jgi:uncharacterized protein (TIGR02996 family)